MSSTGVGPLCFLKSTVNAAIYQEILEHFMRPSADKLYGDADFIFQQDLAPTHTAKGTKNWFNDSRFNIFIHHTEHNQQWNISQVHSMDSAIIWNTSTREYT